MTEPEQTGLLTCEITLSEPWQCVELEKSSYADLEQITCPHETLARLTSLNEVSAFFRVTRHWLKEKGRYVIEVLDVDSMEPKQTYIESEGIACSIYTLEDDRVKVKDRQQEITLLPLPRNILGTLVSLYDLSIVSRTLYQKDVTGPIHIIYHIQKDA